jgi:hypothetical protein
MIHLPSVFNKEETVSNLKHLNMYHSDFKLAIKTDLIAAIEISIEACFDLAPTAG